MKYIRQFRNDDHFPKTYAIYQCDVPGCDGDTTVVVRDPSRFDQSELIRCNKCGQMSGASKRQRLLDRKKILMDEVSQIDTELQIMEMTESKVSTVETSGVAE